MSKFTKLALLLCLALAAAAVRHPAVAATLDEQISARLDALEKENAALRARVNRLEASKAERVQHGAAPSKPGACKMPKPWPPRRMMASPINVGQAVIIGPSNPRHHFEISGSLMYLQPGAGDLEYGTLITPLPITSPNWANQSLKPGFSPSFRVGARYMPSEADDIELNWTHLNNTANGAFSAAPTQMVGPPYLIGPEFGLVPERQRHGAIGL